MCNGLTLCVKVYRYFFTHGLDHGAAAAFGAFHGLELPFVFGNLSIGGYTPSAGEIQLTQQMAAAWTAFAASGDPGWPRYQVGSDRFEQIDVPLASGDGVRSADCDFWDAL